VVDEWYRLIYHSYILVAIGNTQGRQRFHSRSLAAMMPRGRLPFAASYDPHTSRPLD
jgi:hypothetical protein